MYTYSNPPRARPHHGLRLTVRFDTKRSHDGRPCVVLKTVDNFYQLTDRNNTEHMPWEERILSTLTFPTEQEDLRHYIRIHHLSHFDTGVSPVTDDCIVLTGMSEALDLWERWDRAATDAEFSRGPVMARSVKQQLYALLRFSHGVYPRP
ncbi:hypothetical protein N0V85_002349 [Neurospora sp. IMI 360204]|nr:hypothetical protein N0V85_002349 [Neurospora sp. IMI 360204]